MSTPIVGGLSSVIIPCWNGLEFTRKCIGALMRQTGPSWELIVVNNGSTDGTGDYLAGVQDASPVPVTVIANATNRGFPAAINQGLQYARGEYLVLLNNDVVVTDGWLDQLKALTLVAIDGADASRSIPKSKSADRNDTVSRSKRWPGVTVIHFLPDEESDEEGARHEDGKVGLVGPMSNYAAPPQLVEDVPYQDLDDMKSLRTAVARRASREVVYRSQALRVLPAHEASCIRRDRRAR